MVLMLLCAVIKPDIYIKIKKVGFTLDTYWIPCFIAAIICIIWRFIPIRASIHYLWEFSSLNPVGIIILVFATVYISMFLDTTGFFKMCATWAIKKAGKSGTMLFFIIYFTVAVITVLSSNDVAILTFTPFVAFFARAAQVNPIPYLFGQFMSANSWGIMLIISNPTNVVVATGFGHSFGYYCKYAVIPSIVAGLTPGLLVYFIFKKQITKEIVIKGELAEPMSLVNNKRDMWVGLFFLGATIILMACSEIPGFNFELWQIAGAMALILLIYNIVIDIIHWREPHPTKLREILSELPYSIIPFLLSLFVLVSILTDTGLFDVLGKAIGKISNVSMPISVTLYGIIAAIFGNILNNIPLSVALVPVIQSMRTNKLLGPIYGSIIGANLSALITPLGSIAGIMWISLLRANKIKLGFSQFMLIGFIVTPVTLALSLASLMIVLSLW
ncbi:Arsenical pump membrane protein [Trichomonas vaginalis G3]|uniref:Arsenical pump membrane protein n=1 Tax=Trichomonas vaginalis (strain ATCC PRA-98 / G3) TaxID=412133 RepID=A2DFU1_TRIV3|nr:arsenical pump membrane protein family [Trichomonas vaginalis G3]EAY20794.1 Arsenical pump membrane protein [Trichomonas vaginalis G3]KAI5529408.1 arsenical pump membrane protein family [Trichomonas vaginalis G3]|eukprot:XP_001581780.1 Arsenical pump membrane protein [Trichomonas vaginalis G3]